MFQSQTGSPSSSDVDNASKAFSTETVSIPNGKPILFRRGGIGRLDKGKESFNPKREAHPLQTFIPHRKTTRQRMFQSQTGSPSSSDFVLCHAPDRFLKFQSQTGSPSSSDPVYGAGVLRRYNRFNPKREAHPLQTRGRATAHACADNVSIPNGKPILFRPPGARWRSQLLKKVSIPNGKPILFRQSLFILRQGDAKFQSQTGSPSSSDGKGAFRRVLQERVSIPNGKPILFRPGAAMPAGSHRVGFNPKREAHPL